MDTKSFHVESTVGKLKMLKKSSCRTGELEWLYTVSSAHTRRGYLLLLLNWELDKVSMLLLF